MFIKTPYDNVNPRGGVPVYIPLSFFQFGYVYIIVSSINYYDPAGLSQHSDQPPDPINVKQKSAAKRGD